MIDFLGVVWGFVYELGSWIIYLFNTVTSLWFILLVIGFFLWRYKVFSAIGKVVTTLNSIASIGKNIPTTASAKEGLRKAGSRLKNMLSWRRSEGVAEKPHAQSKRTKQEQTGHRRMGYLSSLVYGGLNLITTVVLVRIVIDYMT